MLHIESGVRGRDPSTPQVVRFALPPAALRMTEWRMLLDINPNFPALCGGLAGLPLCSPTSPQVPRPA